MSEREHKVTVYRDDSDEWRWRRQAGNGEIVSDSAEGYQNLDDCLAIASELNDDVEITVV